MKNCKIHVDCHINYSHLKLIFICSIKLRIPMVKKRGCTRNTPWLPLQYLVGGFNPSEKISQLGWLFPIYGRIKHVPNHYQVYSHDIPIQPWFLTSTTSGVPRSGSWTWHALGLYLDQGSRMPVHGHQVAWGLGTKTFGRECHHTRPVMSFTHDKVGIKIQATFQW